MKTFSQFAAASLLSALAASTATLAADPLATGWLETEFGASPVLAWSWGTTLAADPNTGAGKASIKDMAITRVADEHSPAFVLSLLTGRHLTAATLTRGPLSIGLVEVVITSYSVAGSSDPKEPQTEDITLSFQRVTYTVDGESVCFDVALNAPCN